MLYNQPTFTNVFQQFIKWIEHCVQEVQQQKVVSYHPGMYCFSFGIIFVSILLLSSSSTQWIWF